MKKPIKVIAAIVAFVLIAVILFVANGLVGNPVSKFIANKNAQKHIKETYPDMELEIAKATFDFKSGGYNVFVQSPTSIDTHFSVDVSSAGKVRYDSYESNVPGKWNTLRRIDEEYREMVDTILDAEDFPYKTEHGFGFGGLKTKRDILEEKFEHAYGLTQDELEIDKIYDVKELAKTAGQIVLYIEDDEINVKRASEILLDIKEMFDDKNIPFYAINFNLEKHRTEENAGKQETFQVQNFLYSDIYEENLIQRLEEASEELRVYYEKEDAKGKK